MRKRKTHELNRLDVEGFKQARKAPLVLVLDNIRSLNNVGSLFRTADAFRIEHLYLCGITAKPPHRDIHKTALGATESVDWTYAADVIRTVQKLRQDGCKILVLEQTDKSQMLSTFVPVTGEKYAVVLGNEINGVTEEILELADFCVEIPQFGTKHSFNVTVSAGILIWDMLLKLKLL